MKLLCTFFLLIVIAGCNQNDSSKSSTEPKADSKDTISVVKDTTAIHKDSVVIKKPVVADTFINTPYGKELITLSKNILRILKEKNYAGIAKYIHPVDGLRFSMFAYVDTVNDRNFSGKKFAELVNNHKRINWGSDGETEQPIKLSMDNYIKTYFYNFDFLNAKEKSVNKFLGSGNSLNNLNEVYSDCDFTEFYFPGNGEGYDWKTLRLVFKKYKGKTYLVGLVHDEWTI